MLFKEACPNIHVQDLCPVMCNICPFASDFHGAGDIAADVLLFKTVLGSTDASSNGGSPVNFADGFRQINWDPAPTINVSDDKQAAFPGGRFRLVCHTLACAPCHFT